ncbi:MAG: 50S ribosomal protein L23 [Parcubacteria group bacterium 20-58-5]|nr:MAG: 50S ribosomal protein L23 [Parcubacteria group bacterium 20-58-5]OYV63784.1 MAG: 50S ribosomal protein L23 [Parcubacteria group bacterium 21-58-10]
MAIFGDKKKEKKEKKGAARRRARTAPSAAGIAHEIIRAPWFSEKALIITEKGVYTFDVPARATKASIAGAVKEIYNVAPRKIRIVNLPAKKKTLRTKRGEGSRAARRKAYVYLNAGDSIQFA